MSIASDLRTASDKLTESNWHKGAYFKANGNEVCMCVHGAVQSVVNPRVARILGSHGATTDAEASFAAASGGLHVAASSAAAATYAVAASGIGPVDLECAKGLYLARRDWQIPAHFVMGLVGLTTEFNDAPNTTLPMVKEKLSQAIQLAETIGV